MADDKVFHDFKSSCCDLVSYSHCLLTCRSVILFIFKTINVKLASMCCLFMWIILCRVNSRTTELRYDVNDEVKGVLYFKGLVPFMRVISFISNAEQRHILNYKWLTNMVHEFKCIIYSQNTNDAYNPVGLLRLGPLHVNRCINIQP